MTPLRTPNLVLRAWREAHGLTRPQMADALNDTPAGQHGQILCHPKLIAKWESGKIRWPSARYRQALRQLTGHDLTALGFTAPAAGPLSLPSGGSDLKAIDDLAALAAHLHARGYTTHLAASLPRLIIGHPQAGDPQPITATGPHFCWAGTPFSQRPPTVPLATTADAIGVLTGLATGAQQTSRSRNDKHWITEE
jgi:transcriptional regulator with XRE-family HTH domain